jgi:hypothetical protein
LEDVVAAFTFDTFFPSGVVVEEEVEVEQTCEDTHV